MYTAAVWQCRIRYDAPTNKRTEFRVLISAAIWQIMFSSGALAQQKYPLGHNLFLLMFQFKPILSNLTQFHDLNTKCAYTFAHTRGCRAFVVKQLRGNCIFIRYG